MPPEAAPQDAQETARPGVLRLAFSGPVVRRAAAFGVIVGSLLVCINHNNCCLNGRLGKQCMIQIVLTMCVPYAVSTVSSVLAIRDQHSR